jgi:hypothetical protein
MRGSEAGSRHPARRVEPPPWAGLHQLGLILPVVPAATTRFLAASPVRMPSPGSSTPSWDSRYRPALR